MTVTSGGLHRDVGLRRVAVASEPVEVPPPDPPLGLHVRSIEAVGERASHFDVTGRLVAVPSRELTFRVSASVAKPLLLRFASEAGPIDWQVQPAALSASWTFDAIALVSGRTTQENSRSQK